MKKIGLIGCGKMAEAMLRGLGASGKMNAFKVVASDLNESRRKVAVTLGASAVDNVTDAVRGADVIVLAVKPQNAADVCKSVASKVRRDALIVSICAGITTSSLHRWMGVEQIVRAMPNTPAAIQKGITAWSYTDETSDESKAVAQELLSSFGDEIAIPENMIDQVTAISGSGPAYSLLFIESMIDVGVHIGLPRETARELVLKTMLGTVLYAIKESEKHPVALKNDISSPAGTTAAALYAADKGNFRTVVSDSVSTFALLTFLILCYSNICHHACVVKRSTLRCGLRIVARVSYLDSAATLVLAAHSAARIARNSILLVVRVMCIIVQYARALQTSKLPIHLWYLISS